ncbi:MAG: hypothetical protein RLZZ53_1788 [Acidobacteriota bacterium]|jgi:SAM-dependent methyltransferase
MDESPRLVTRCPACHGDALTTVGQRASAFDVELGGRVFRQPAYDVRRCETCGLHFKSVTLTPQELSVYYQWLDGAMFDVDADFPTDRVLFERLRGVPDGSRVLDYGCSTGRMLKDSAGRLRCVGVEPNAPAAAVARSRGITIVDDEQLDREPPFQAIILADVFEHLVEPMPLLRRLAARLAPGGWLAIITGDAGAITVESRMAEHWYFRLPGHVVMLTERHLAWIASQLALRLTAVERCSHYRVPLAERIKQRAQEVAYDVMRDAPGSVAAGVVRRLPRLGNAQHWPNAPALTYRDDHVVAFLQREHD